VQIVWGAQDKVIPVQYADAFGKLIPSARVKVIEQCGHLPHIEKTQEVLNTINDFEEVPQ